jgi:superfamily II DNA or RNA helicase
MEVWPVWHEAKGRVWGDNHGARVLCVTRDRKRNERIVRFIKRMYDAGRQSVVVGEKVDHLELLMVMSERAGVPKSAMGQFTSQRTVTKKVQAGDRWQEVRNREKVKAHELERVKRESQIIFATYGMMKEGIDIPRLDSGISVTPRSDATQLIGRIRRPYPGKKQPVLWVDIVDAKCGPFLGYYKARLAEYQESGAKVAHRQ